MMRGGRLLAALTGLALVCAACPSSRPSPTPSASANANVTPRPGGTVTVAYPAEPATLDPFTPSGDTPATRDLARMLMPGLYKITPSGERTRWLLASDPVETTGPPFSISIALRDDAVWSDGVPITVDDIVFTWKLAVRSDRAAIGREGYDQISRIVVESPTRARIEFRSHFRRWRDLFSAGEGVLPAHALSTPQALAGLSSGWPVSGGPFVLKAWHRGLDMIFEPNPHAWNGRPLLEQIRVVFVPDDIGALALFARGSVNVLGPYQAADWIRRVSAVAHGEVSTDQGQTWLAVVLDTRKAPLTDVQVRQAFADSMDRARIVVGLLQAEGTSLNAVPPGSSAFERYGNADRARATLAADGWRGSGVRTKGGKRLSFTIAVADSDGLGSIVARAIEYESARVGMDVQALTLSEDRLVGEWLPGARFDTAILTWRDPPEGAARERFGSGSGAGNVARLSDKTLNSDLAADDAASSPRDAAQARLAALVPVVPIATLAVTLVGSARVHGLAANAEADGPFWNAEQWFLR
ncbi:MAG: ABC transporter substrate-binding protein [Actinomycetota bacterium]